MHNKTRSSNQWVWFTSWDLCYKQVDKTVLGGCSSIGIFPVRYTDSKIICHWSMHSCYSHVKASNIHTAHSQQLRFTTATNSKSLTDEHSDWRGKNWLGRRARNSTNSLIYPFSWVGWGINFCSINSVERPLQIVKNSYNPSCSTESLSVRTTNSQALHINVQK